MIFVTIHAIIYQTITKVVMIMCTSLSSDQEALKHWSSVPKKKENL